jgi:hypothetical protein
LQTRKPALQMFFTSLGKLGEFAAIRTIPLVLLVGSRLETDARKVKPLERAVVVLARNHLTERDALTQAVDGFVGIGGHIPAERRQGKDAEIEPQYTRRDWMNKTCNESRNFSVEMECVYAPLFGGRRLRADARQVHIRILALLRSALDRRRVALVAAQLGAAVIVVVVASGRGRQRRGRRRARLLAAGLDVRGRAAVAVDGVKQPTIRTHVRQVLGAEHKPEVGAHVLLVHFETRVQLLDDQVDVVVALLALSNLGDLAGGERLVRLAHAVAQLVVTTRKWGRKI